MRNFKEKKGNFIKSSNSTEKMMYHTIICLVPIIIFSFYKNGIYPVVKGGDIKILFKPLLMVIVPMITCIITEYLFYLVKKDKKSILFLIKESFAIMPGIFIGLIIPINTPIWLIIIAAFIASMSKMLCGGLGKNIFNPALVGALIIIIFASSYIGSKGGYLNSYEIDAISKATPLSNFSAMSYAGTYEEIVTPYGSLLSFFLGNIPGAVGETSSLICLVSFIYLVINKVIKWRISISYVATVFVLSLIIGSTNGLGVWYPVFCILSGSVIFASVFMVTDPVTSPITKHGQILGGIILGILTIFIRYLTHYPEGVLISILIFNVITIFINKLSIKYDSNSLYKTISISLLLIIAIILSMVISKKIDYNPSSTLDPYFNVTNKEKSGNNTIYYVTSRGYSGKNSIKSKITMNNGNIINLEIIENDESYFGLIEKSDYLNELINNQNNLDNVDAVSGATYTSNYLKELIEKIKMYDRSK